MKALGCAVLISVFGACQQRPGEQRAEPKHGGVIQMPAISVACKAERSQGGITVATRITFAKQPGIRVYRVSEVMTVIGDARQYYVVGRKGSILQVSARLYPVPDNVDFEVNYSGVRLEELLEPTTLQEWTIPLPILPTVPPYTNVGIRKAPLSGETVQSIEVEIGFLSTSGVDTSEPFGRIGLEPLIDSNGSRMLVDRQVVKTAACAVEPSAR